jgi:hypothetical protein
MSSSVVFPSVKWLDNSANSNVLRASYVNGVLDVSNEAIFRTDASLCGNVGINGSVSIANSIGMSGVINQLIATPLQGGYVYQQVATTDALTAISQVAILNSLVISGNATASPQLAPFCNPTSGNVVTLGTSNVNTILGGLNNYVTGNLITINDVSINADLFVALDTSLNARLFVKSDTSMNARLFVAQDVSINGLSIGLGAQQLATNTVIGRSVLQQVNNPTSTNNTALGYQALFASTNPINDTAIGSMALSANTTGSNNTAVGYGAGAFVTTGGNITCVGSQTGFASSATQYNKSTAIGYGATISLNNQIVLGTAADSTVHPGNVAVGSAALPAYTLDVTGTGRFTSDVSINGNLVVGNLVVGGALTVQQLQNKSIINTTTSNYQLIVTEDISLNGRLFTSGNVYAGPPLNAGAAGLPITNSQNAFHSFVGNTSPGQVNPIVAIYNNYAVSGTTVNDPTPMLQLHRGGTNSSSFDAIANFNLTKHVAGLNSNTRLDIALGNGALNSPDTNVMTLQSNGFVGIGTTAPTFNLDVTGKARFTSDVSINGISVGLGGGSVFSNTAFGSGALAINTTGGSNCAFGWSALQSNTTGLANTAFGQGALSSNTTSESNSAFGFSALSSNTTGIYNNAFGRAALITNTTGNSNNAFGQAALRQNTTGTNNTAIGSGAGYNNSQAGCSYNTYLGSGTDIDNAANAWTQSTAVGNNARITASNQITLGTAAEAVYVPGKLSIGTTQTAHALDVFGGNIRANAVGGSNDFKTDLFYNYPFSTGMFQGTGDAGSSNNTFNLALGSWYSIGFMDTCYRVNRINMEVRAGAINSVSHNLNGFTSATYTPLVSTTLSSNSWTNTGITWTSSQSTYFGTDATYSAKNVFSTTPNGTNLKWASLSGTYAGSGLHTGSNPATTVSGYTNVTSVSGEWIQIQANTPVVLSNYYLHSSDANGVGSGMPKTWWILGSNDGTNWNPIHYCAASAPYINASNGTYASSSSISFWTGGVAFGPQTSTLTNTNYGYHYNSFTYFRMVVSSTFGGTNLVDIGRWVLNFNKPSTAALYMDPTIVNQMNITGGLATTGNVGIGTSNPTYKLDVTGTARFTSDVSINGNLLIKGGLTVEQMQNKTIINTTTSNYQLIVTEDISLNGRLFVSGNVYAGPPLLAGVSIGQGSTYSANAQHLFVGNTSPGQTNPIMAILNNYVTSATALNDPTPMLYLGRGGTSSGSYQASVNFNLSRYVNSGLTASTRLDIALGNGNTAIPDTNVMTLQSNGFVGIGTTAPPSRLTIRNNYTDGSGGGLCINSDDPNIYRLYLSSYVQAANQVGYQFQVANQSTTSTSLAIGYNGAVGIGTTAPQYALDVTGTARFTNGFTILPGATASTYTSSYLNDNMLFIRADGNHGLCYGANNNTKNTGIDGPFLFGFAGGVLGTTYGGNKSALTWLNSGNVGIGTTNPLFTLDVSGKARFTSDVSMGGNVYAGPPLAQGGANQPGTSNLNAFHSFVGNTVTGSSSSPIMAIYNNNATSATVLNDPTPILALRRGGTSSVNWDAAASFNLSRYANTGSNSNTRLDIALGNTSNSAYADTNIMTLHGNGNVGIRTIAPATTLDVNGALSSSTTTSGQMFNFAKVSTANTWYKIASMTDSQGKCTFRISGVLGCSDNSAYKIDVVLTVNNVATDMFPKIDFETIFGGGTLWNNFRIVYVLDPNNNRSVLYIKTLIASVQMNLNIVATSKNTGSIYIPTFYENTSYSLAFTGTMSSATDSTLSATSVTNFDAYTSANLRSKSWNESGNVGIGTLTPSATLDVAGTVSQSAPSLLSYSTLPSFATNQIGYIVNATASNQGANVTGSYVTFLTFTNLPIGVYIIQGGTLFFGFSSNTRIDVRNDTSGLTYYGYGNNNSYEIGGSQSSEKFTCILGGFITVTSTSNSLIWKAQNAGGTAQGVVTNSRCSALRIA